MSSEESFRVRVLLKREKASIFTNVKRIGVVNKYNVNSFFGPTINTLERYTNILLRTYDANGENNDNSDIGNLETYICNNCRNIYSTYKGIRAHYKKDIICNALCNIDNLTAIECTRWENEISLNKHLKYRFRLTISEK